MAEEMTVPARRRLAAILSLVLAAVAVVGAVVALTDDVWRLILVPALLVGFTYGGWTAATRLGKVRLLGLALALVCVIGLVALILTSKHHGLVTSLLGLVAVGSVACARYALGRTRAALKAAPVPGVDVGPAQHGVLIMNLRSGGGKAERFELERRCRERGIEPIVLQQGDDLLELARDAIARGADVIGMAGGDGSQALVATIASEAGVPHVCIPAGTRNHFAADLGLDRDDVVGALDAYGSASERTIDLAEVNGRVFVNNVSLGVYAKVVQSDEYRDAKGQTVAKMLPEMLGPDADPFDLQFVDAEGVDRSGAAVVQISNNPYVLTRLGGFGYRPALDTGQLGIAAIDVTGGIPGPVEWQAATFRVDSGSPIEAGIDGEALVLDPPLEFRMRPGALRVRLPHHAYGYSPAAVRASSPWTAYHDLWDAIRGSAKLAHGPDEH